MSQTRKAKKSKSYEIHDNGGRPFFVQIDGKRVTVLKNMDTFKLVKGKFVDIKAPPKELFTITADEIHIGKKSPKGGYDGLSPNKAEGNSILLKVGSKYMYIGSEIYEFTPIAGDTIVAYYSDIGNNDVPYPYAVGKMHIYIMLDKVAVEKSYFDMSKDVYTQYYFDTYVRDCENGFGNKNICKDKEAVKEKLEARKKAIVKLKTKQIMKRQ